MNKLIVLTGPTSVGKTALSIKLAHKINGEIISADSMQVYKKMDIGSAKIMPDQMDGIKHHLIDILEPTDEFNVYIFKKLAMEAINNIYSNDHIPIIVGGTAFYIQSVLYDINFDDEDNSVIRKQLEHRANEIGSLALYEELKAIDPDYASTLHPNNVKKVIRALEYIKLNGKLFSVHNNEERNKTSPFDFKYFALTDERNHLYENIEKRVDMMFDMGLLDEVKSLYDEGLSKDMVSMQGLGYKELLDYFDDKCSLQEAKDKIKLETRHFAKRQMTYLRRERDVIFIDKSKYDYDEDKILDYMLEVIKNDRQ